MLTEKIKNPKTKISKQKLEHLNDYMIKIDYFDQKGTKNLENNIPLTCILNPVFGINWVKYRSELFLTLKV